MSRLDELIAELCPDGVEYKSLGELGKFYGGLTGKSKSDFENGNAKFITYRNVYLNPSLDIDPAETVRIEEGEKQNILQKGDVIFTGSSETPDECGFSSVVTSEPRNALYLNSFCFFLRFFNQNIILPDFAKHLFRSSNLRYQIGRTASGVTRFNVSKDKMAKVRIPVPPLEVQREIVRILDNFTFLSAELSAELSAREKQYEYYSNVFFEQLAKGNTTCTVADVVVSLKTGLNPRKNFKLNEEGSCLPYVTGKDIYNNSINISEKTDYITRQALELINKRADIHSGMLLFASTGTGTVGIMAIVNNYNNEWGMSETLYGIAVDERVITPHYLMYCLYSSYAKKQFEPKISKGSVPHLKVKDLLSVRIPLPTLEEQNITVERVGKLDRLINDISAGLPAEIESRQKQYEYYRDKLLTFKEKEN